MGWTLWSRRPLCKDESQCQGLRSGALLTVPALLPVIAPATYPVTADSVALLAKPLQALRSPARLATLRSTLNLCIPQACTDGDALFQDKSALLLRGNS